MQLSSGITDETLFQWGVVIGASLVAAIYDLRTRRIPNALTVPLLAAGLVWAAWRGGLSGLAEAVGACFLLALPYVLLFLYAKGGAGDAKLMGAIGAWLGLAQGITVLLCVVTAGCVLAIATALAKKRLKSVLTSIFLSFYRFMLLLSGYRTMQHTADRDDVDQRYDLTIPYGVAIFAGVCVAGGIVLIW